MPKITSRLFACKFKREKSLELADYFVTVNIFLPSNSAHLAGLHVPKKQFFLSGSFFCALKKKGLSPSKKPLFLRRSAKEKKSRLKRTSKKNRYFGTCKPTNC